MMPEKRGGSRNNVERMEGETHGGREKRYLAGNGRKGRKGFVCYFPGQVDQGGSIQGGFRGLLIR